MPAKGKGYSREWWTRERVVAGLRRLHRDTGESPTARRRYSALVGPVDRGRIGARRRYPSAYSVSRHFEGFAEAWRAAGVEASSPTGVALVSGVEGLRRAKAHRPGERHGRLVVVCLAGHRERGGARRALWLCRCDCGRERVVESGRLGAARECTPCALETRRNNLKPFALAHARPEASARRADVGT